MYFEPPFRFYRATDSMNITYQCFFNLSMTHNNLDCQKICKHRSLIYPKRVHGVRVSQADERVPKFNSRASKKCLSFISK